MNIIYYKTFFSINWALLKLNLFEDEKLIPVQKKTVSFVNIEEIKERQ